MDKLHQCAQGFCRKTQICQSYI